MGQRLAASLDAVRLALTGASVLALALSTPGCLLDSSGTGVRLLAYTCTATLQSDAGEIEEISSTDARFDTEALLSGAGCSEIGVSGEVDGYWRRLVESVISVDPDFVERGPWCLARTACTELVEVPESAECPGPLPAEMPATCRPGEGCLALVPPGSPTEPAFESQVRFGSVDVGDIGGPIVVTITNDTCGETVQIVADGAIGGRDPEQFTSAVNTCLPDSPDGHALAPGDSCQLSFAFSPQAHGGFGANSIFSRDGAERYGIALRGDGMGGAVTVPDRICLGELVGPRPECAGGNGTAAVTVTVIHLGGPPVTVREVVVGGSFRAAHAAPVTLSAGGNTSIDVSWCEAGLGDVDGEGLMVIDTNGADGDGSGAVHVFLDRIAEGCP